MVFAETMGEWRDFMYSGDSTGQKNGSRIPRGLGLGCWEFSDIGTGKPDDAKSIDIIQAAFDNGIKHFDTAQSYGDGHSETVVGKALEHCMDDVYIATKLHASNKEDTFVKVNQSTIRLKTEPIDLVYIHWPKKGVDLRPMMEALLTLKEEGRIRHIGVSNFTLEDMELIAEVGSVDAYQMCYNLLWRYPEQDIIPYCREHSIEIVTYSSIAQGLLTEKRRSPDSFEAGDARARTIYYRDDVWPELSQYVEQLREAAHEHGRTLNETALAWVLAQPGVVSSLVGARSIEQVKSNIASAGIALDEDLQKQLLAVSEKAMSVLPVPETGNIFLYFPKD